MADYSTLSKVLTSWVKFGGEGRTNNFCFLGKDVVAFGQGSYVLFLNLKNVSGGQANFSIYEADGMANHADGVACFSAHGLVPIFAIAENKLKAQIHLLAYPTFAEVSKLKKETISGYQALAFSEGETMVSLSQQPDFVLTVWNWITGEDLKTVSTGITTFHQELKCVSNSPVLISQSSEETNELKIWEVSFCYSTCHVVSKLIEMPNAIFSSVCWAPEGILWFMNDNGDVYSVDSQTFTPKLFHQQGQYFNLSHFKPAIAYFKASLIVSTPDGHIKTFKKHKGKWTDKSHKSEMKNSITKMITSIDFNILIAWTALGEILKLHFPESSEEKNMLQPMMMCNFGESIFDFCIINPEQEYFSTISRRELLQTWKSETGELVNEFNTGKGFTSLMEHPLLPIVVLSSCGGELHFINLSNISSPSTLCRHLLDKLEISSVTFDRTGTYVIAGCLRVGTFFLLKAFPESEDFYRVVCCLNYKDEILSFGLIGSKSLPCLVLLLPHFSDDAKALSGNKTENLKDETSLVDKLYLQERKAGTPGQQIVIYKINDENAISEIEEVFILHAMLNLPLTVREKEPINGKAKNSYYSTLAGQSFLKDNELFAFPASSNKIHVLEIDIQDQENVNEAKLIRTINAVHQVRCIGNNIKSVCAGSTHRNDCCMLTYGADGLIILYHHNKIEKDEEPLILRSHHYFKSGVRKAACNSTGTYVLSLGWDGCIVGKTILFENINITSEFPQKRQKVLDEQLKTIELLKTLEPKEITGLSKTWIEMKAEEELEKEMLKSAQEKAIVNRDFQQLKHELNVLIEQNETASVDKKLPLERFELDQEWREERLKKGEMDRQEEELKLQNTIKEYDEKAEALKQACWEPMEVKGKCIMGILEELEVENYPLLPDGPDFEEKVGHAVERRTMEIELTFSKRFTPWMPKSESYNARLLQQGISQKSLPRPSTEQDERTRLYMAMMSDEELEEPDISIEEEEPPPVSDHNMDIFEWSGSTSHKFVNVPHCLHSQQLELYAIHSLINETILLEFITDKLRKYFNAEHGKTLETKSLVMLKSIKRIARLREIQSEHQWCLGALNLQSTESSTSLALSIKQSATVQPPLVSVTTVYEPKWDPREIPEVGIMSVQDSEVNAIPYLSPEEEKILADKAEEAERLRKLREADNFRELALIEMMDGVLEVRWEDVIKKNIPKPFFMETKDPADWNEPEIRMAKEYDTKVKFLQSERDRYRKLLEHEFETRNEDLMRELSRFDKNLQNLHKLKLHVEASIIQENMKMIEMQLRNDKLNTLKAKEKSLLKEICDTTQEAECAEKELQQLHLAVKFCADAYESIMLKDKHLDQGFRKEGDNSAAVSEQRYKLFKRRPKTNLRSALSMALVNEVWKLHGCKPESWKESREMSLQKKVDQTPAFSHLLPHDAVDFLQNLDAMDSYSNSFPGIDEEGWANLCKCRRGKIQNEIKAKVTAHELAECETAYKQCQKSLNAMNTKLEAMKEEVKNICSSKLDLCHNAQVQLIMKNGSVEIDLTGSTNDFSDAILIHRSVIEEINDGIKDAGNIKLKAMQTFADFRRKVLLHEWEHRKMKLEIQDLVDHIDLVEKTKVTKDMLELLASDNVEKSPKVYDREVALVKEVYGKKIKDVQDKIYELDTKIEVKERENMKLDSAIRSVNVDVNEQLLQTDTQLDQKYTNSINTRLNALVKRSRLVNEIQEQYNDILVLQTELELLRLKTFPTFKYMEIP